MNQLLIEKLPGKSCLPGPQDSVSRRARILVVPLDWGLGHATRCIPIIRELLAQGCEVWLAGEGAQEHLLKEEFPKLSFLHLDGYRIRYSRSALGLLLSMFRQTHKIITAIKKENAWLKKMIAEYNFDAVISDNRFGLYHASVPCIFITHQLTIKSPLGPWSERILQKRNYRFINRFTACWVPDHEHADNLAGELSHPVRKPVVPVHYIGPLSRFDLSTQPASPSASLWRPKGDGVKEGHLLIILSGPEPQRSILEDTIIKEISHYHATAIIVRGLPGTTSLIPSGNMIRFYNHLPADELNKEMMKAEIVISRSGYSTVMDLMALQKKSILLPTPGQTEQEYLARHLSQKQFAFCISQKEFSLAGSLAKARQLAYHFPEVNTGQVLQQAVANFIAIVVKE